MNQTFRMNWPVIPDQQEDSEAGFGLVRELSDYSLNRNRVEVDVPPTSPSSALPNLLAREVFTLSSLAVCELSKQHSYDVGPRALTSPLCYARKKLCSFLSAADEESLSTAMKDMDIVNWLLVLADTPLRHKHTRYGLPPHPAMAVMRGEAQRSERKD
ncbi:unnamed protein product [Pleuronectes platessa]|uniref:Uncharacterized protein n=1 Tax=Pleuronectes platessa TaxID=8262 RepID=A0A9N7U3R8_PLEPL|nr:unnamed protein product [Pleuronectes platessa]